MIPVWVYPLAAALVLAIGWRASARFRIRRRLAAALRSPREVDRTVGARECVAVGVTETAGMLIRLVRREQSRAVLDELVIALAERQWEPASKAAMVDLRLWARAYALEHPDVLAVAGHAPLEPPAPPAPGAPPEPSSPPPRSPVPEVAPTTVLVAGASGPAATATIRELRRLGHRVVATDRDPLSAGLRLADVSQVVPAPGEPGFAVCVVQAIRSHGVTAMICTAADEQDALQQAGDELTATGVRWAPPRPGAPLACTDSQYIRATLQDNGLSAPVTGLAELAGAGVRPFTADALVTADAQASGVVTHWRADSPDGWSVRSEIFTDHRASDSCARALKVLRLTGPASVLGAITDDHEPVLLEVYPYFSAQLTLSLHAGADLVGQHVRQVFGLPVLAERLVPRPGVVMTRNVQESFQE